MNNFALRTLSAVVFVAVMVFSLLWNPGSYGAVFLLVMVVSMQEFFSFSLGQQFLREQKLAIFGASALFTLVLCQRSFGMDPRWAVAGTVPFLLIPVSAIFHKEHDGFGNLAYILAAVVYIAAPVISSLFLTVDAFGGFAGTRLLSMFTIIWLCDTGAYCVGCTLGRRPWASRMAPSISPKKSWVGFWGGLLFGVLSSYILHLVGWLDFSLVHCLAIGIVVCLGSVCGDLFESLWKRFFDVKDSGSFIPGHGGMLDRFDSSFVAIPMALVYLKLFGLL